MFVFGILVICYVHGTIILLEDSRNYVPLNLVPFSAKRIVTKVLVIAKLNGIKDFILRVFVCDINRPSKDLAVQSY